MIHSLKHSIQAFFSFFGYQVIRKHTDSSSQPAVLPPLTFEDLHYLKGTNPKLQDLRSRYSQITVDAQQHSLWAGDFANFSMQLAGFRGPSAYVWMYDEQPRAMRLKYYIFADYVQRKNPELLSRLTEDGAFSAVCYDFAKTGRVSRDRMDSTLELDFLDRHLKLLSHKGLSVLDIGAGYGRLAHRMSQAASDLQDYCCVDSVPESTFLCEFYTRYRSLDKSVRVVSFDELTRQRKTLGRFDVAFNVHSFSECTYAAIRWWIELVRDLAVPYLFIVPNDSVEFLSTETDHTRRDFLPLIVAAGYRRIVTEPLFIDPDVRELIGVMDHLFLFERVRDA